MALTDLYLTTTKNLGSFLTTLVGAQAPPQFTIKFLVSLGFKGTNDRLFVKMLKELRFLDQSGKPTQTYFDYLDQSQSRVVFARSIKSAYADLFQIDKKANSLGTAQVKNKLKTLTQGKKSEVVYQRMAATFVDLCKYGDFETSEQNIVEVNSTTPTENESLLATGEKPTGINVAGLHYNIQIHLPDTRDAAVYDAIFQSLKRHLS